MKLYEIDEALLLGFDPETGVIFDEAYIDALKIEQEKKTEGLCLWYKDLIANAKAIRDEEVTLAERRHVLERKAESIKGYLDRRQQGKKFETAKVAISYRKSEQVEIDDLTDIPLEYTTTEIKPDKKAIKNAIKAGEAILGAHIVEMNNISIK